MSDYRTMSYEDLESALEHLRAESDRAWEEYQARDYWGDQDYFVKYEAFEASHPDLHQAIDEIAAELARRNAIEARVAALFAQRFPPGSDGPGDDFDIADLYQRAEEEFETGQL